ncbi:hypothetical protein GOARA_061_00380 [Gordonia araii NBRC 100433]|uniref:Diacylglycerol O-acyltransferase n=1 Tax=Gordonia araii NBRC 100433 TaxID=1073574 RepID=G7H424_9ACTN|nr:hypothetical protein [Gordonia araii]NNG96336.1 hypothetical protein [Gordonia araii NBRC 100433]GAB10599.1 hypothetical protein GOARA_061_00380 [Gordonia araii NBRC 100433]
MRLTPVDARMLWASPTARSDQFLLFAFDDTDATDTAVAAEVLDAALAIERLNLAVRAVPGHLDYPYWTHRAAGSEQIRIHRLDDSSWAGLLDLVSGLLADQVDPYSRAWRVHLVRGVAHPHGEPGRLRVAILQVSHALADGRGATDLARRLFGGAGGLGSPDGAVGRGPAASRWPAPVRAVGGIVRLPAEVGGMLARGARAYLLSRQERMSGPQPEPASSVNRAPGARRAIRTLTVDRARLDGRVTPGAIAAVGDAMATCGLVDGDPVVELTVARAPERGQANNFFMAGIASHTDSGGATRRRAIETEIEGARSRDSRPARVAARRAEASTPAALMHWAATAFTPETVTAVTGHTVVSSVNRGAADLRLGGGLVRFTAGFPALSSAHSLTHGVHGIGDAITFSVLADPDIVDIDAYLTALEAVI